MYSLLSELHYTGIPYIYTHIKLRTYNTYYVMYCIKVFQGISYVHNSYPRYSMMQIHINPLAMHMTTDSVHSAACIAMYI